MLVVYLFVCWSAETAISSQEQSVDIRQVTRGDDGVVARLPTR